MNYKLPYAAGNGNIWKEPISMQHPLADIEIIAWDSSLTAVICKDDSIIDTIKIKKEDTLDFKDYIRN